MTMRRRTLSAFGADNDATGRADTARGTGNVAGIVLAAGCASRMNGLCKLVLPVQGEPMILRGIRSMMPWCGRIVVVTGAHAETVGMALRACPSCERVHNARLDSSMIVSVKAALRHLYGERSDLPAPGRVFILPGDCAFADPVVYGVLLVSDADVAVPSHEGRAGHPVLLSSEAARWVLHAPDNATLRTCLADFSHEQVEVADPGILEDVDTPDAYLAVLRRVGGGRGARAAHGIA